MGWPVSRRGHGLSVEQLRAFLEASCAAQGVPVLVTDPAVVAKVGALLGAREAPRAAARAAPTAATLARHGTGQEAGNPASSRA